MQTLIFDRSAACRGVATTATTDKTRSAEPVLFELAVQGPLADPEELGGLLAVPAGELEGLADGLLLELLKQLAHGQVVPVARRQVQCGVAILVSVGDPDGLTSAEPVTVGDVLFLTLNRCPGM